VISVVIADLLKHKGSAVVTIGSRRPVSELIRLLGEHRIGGVVVVDDDAIVGIVSERDVVRGLGREGAGIVDGSVASIMTTAVISCRPSDTLDEIAATMTERRIRHMPVVADGRLAGIVTIGDVVAAQLRTLEAERRQLEDYITRG
jgi:CBS domain-containing protein